MWRRNVLTSVDFHSKEITPSLSLERVTSIISALRRLRLRKEECEFEASLVCYIVRLSIIIIIIIIISYLQLFLLKSLSSG